MSGCLPPANHCQHVSLIPIGQWGLGLRAVPCALLPPWKARHGVMRERTGHSSSFCCFSFCCFFSIASSRLFYLSPILRNLTGSRYLIGPSSVPLLHYLGNPTMVRPAKRFCFVSDAAASESESPLDSLFMALPLRPSRLEVAPFSLSGPIR